MLVWILIAACWSGLLLLILHDATKNADGVSPVSIASRKAVVASRSASRKAIFTSAKGWRRLRRRIRHATAAKSSKASPAEALVEVSAATIAPEVTEPSNKQTEISKQIEPPKQTEPPKPTWWRKDRRTQITPAELELTIAEAVRKNAPGCGSFVGVIVHHKKPKQYRDPNWGVRGVKFGKADRRVVDENLPRIVEQLQKEFRLADSQLRN